MLTFDFDADAFTSGQIDSKLWLLEHLEAVVFENKMRSKPLSLTLLAGWYGMTAFLAQARRKLDLDITLLDLDPKAVEGAMLLNEAMIRQNRFRAQVADILTHHYDIVPDIVINTSAEHMTGEWFDNIPHGTLVLIQANDMTHDDHAWSCQSTAQMEKRFPLGEIYRSVSLDFTYPDWKFTRFMLIGKK